LERNHLATLLCTKNAITLATWCGGVPEEHKIMGLNPWREVLAIYGYIAKL
jgi:3-polyprenyl-4-hydroxybenzoate decarboxylase